MSNTQQLKKTDEAGDVSRLRASLTAESPAIPSLRSEDPGVIQSRNCRLGLIVGPGQHKREDGSTRYDLSVIDLDHEEFFSLALIPMGFFGHGVVPDPARPERVSVFEKWGSGACEIDLTAGEVVRPITTAADRQFYGHGAYSPDGGMLYNTETITSGDYKGVIAVRDAVTHDYLGDMPSFGSSPHDCHLIDDGKTMVVTNGGGPHGGAEPCVCYVDVKAEKLLEKLTFDTADINAGHMARTANGDLAIVSAQRQGMDPRASVGGVSLKPAGGQLSTMAQPREVVSRLTSESLSVCVHDEREMVAATTPLGNLLTLWDLPTGRLLRYYEVDNPRGVALTRDGSCFIVSYGADVAKISLLDVATLDKVKDYDMHWTGLTGSHVISYSLPAGLRNG